MLLLLRPHAVVVEPVNDRLRVDAQITGELLDATLVGVGVVCVRLAQHLLLVACEEHACLLEGWGGLRVGEAAGGRRTDGVGVDARTPLLGCKQNTTG